MPDLNQTLKVLGAWCLILLESADLRDPEPGFAKETGDRDRQHRLGFTLLLTLLSEVPNVAAQAPERTFEIGALTRKLAAHLIQCLAGQHHKVELIKNDPGLGKVVGRTLDVGRAHIHGNRLDLGGIASMLAERLGKGPEGL